MSSNAPGLVHGLQTSNGGVPKQPVDAVDVTEEGLNGDAQRDLRVHGGPDRAVCLLALEVITALQGEGHPIEPGSTGENVTVAGVGTAFPPGSRLVFDSGVTLEITGPAAPCSNIRASFRDGDFHHLSVKRDPERARHYARVLVPGRLAVGDGVRCERPT